MHVYVYTVYTYAMDRILRGGLQRPGRAVRLHPQLSGQESQEPEEPRSGTEGREPEGRQDYYSGPLTFTTRYTVTHVRIAIIDSIAAATAYIESLTGCTEPLL